MTARRATSSTHYSRERELFTLDNLTNGDGQPSTPVPFEFEQDGLYSTQATALEDHASRDGALAQPGRLRCIGKTVCVTCGIFDDFPFYRSDEHLDGHRHRRFRGGQSSMSFRRHAKVVQRCLLMTTDPGDLVLDPTCGSGTTAYVAEQWGRRWITIDTSRVPLALARQRLLTATFPLRAEGRGARPGRRVRLQAQAEQEGRGGRRHRPARHAQEHRQQRAAGRGGARRSAGE